MKCEDENEFKNKRREIEIIQIVEIQIKVFFAPLFFKRNRREFSKRVRKLNKKTFFKAIINGSVLNSCFVLFSPGIENFDIIFSQLVFQRVKQISITS